jgi:hypothetical protein
MRRGLENERSERDFKEVNVVCREKEVVDLDLVRLAVIVALDASLDQRHAGEFSFYHRLHVRW